MQMCFRKRGLRSEEIKRELNGYDTSTHTYIHTYVHTYEYIHIYLEIMLKCKCFINKLIKLY